MIVPILTKTYRSIGPYEYKLKGEISTKIRYATPFGENIMKMLKSEQKIMFDSYGTRHPSHNGIYRLKGVRDGRWVFSKVPVDYYDTEFLVLYGKDSVSGEIYKYDKESKDFVYLRTRETKHQKKKFSIDLKKLNLPPNMFEAFNGIDMEISIDTIADTNYEVSPDEIISVINSRIPSMEIDQTNILRSIEHSIDQILNDVSD